VILDQVILDQVILDQVIARRGAASPAFRAVGRVDFIEKSIRSCGPISSRLGNPEGASANLAQSVHSRRPK
jgi:hypothetical protein